MWPFFQRRSRSIEEIAEAIDDGGAGAGGRLSTRAALDVSVVMACVQIIADGIAVPEMHVFRALEDGKKERAIDEKAYRLLHRRPNDWQTSFELRQMMTMHCALVGEAFAIPVMDKRGKGLSEIIPLMPEWVSVQERGRYDTRYIVHDEFGPIGEFGPTQILHLRNMSWTKTQGLKPVRQAAKAIGLAAAAENNLTKLHENGGRPSGIIKASTGLSPEAVERLKAAWRKVTRGSGRGGTAVLDSGMEFQSIAMKAIDSQTLETRRFQVEEICRAFGVYPIMVGHSDKAATYASAEAFFAAHNRRTVMRWQRMWVEKLDEYILDGEGPLFCEFDNREVTLAPIRDQSEYFAKALGTGGGVPFLTVNEVRGMQGLAPIEGGDVLREPAASTLAPEAETTQTEDGEDDDDES